MTSGLILAMVCGQPPTHILARHGDYLRWFQDSMDKRVTLHPWSLHEQRDEPDLREFAGLLITGSPASLTQPEPWMENAIEMIRHAAEIGTPTLGVCFGHQLIGAAFGAPTTQAPGAGEHGSHQVTLTEKGKVDPLFANMPSGFDAQLSHHDQVDPDAVAYGNGLAVLASSALCPVQALAAGDHIRGVQFHPEFSQEIMQSYLDPRAPAPASRSCEHAATIFQNWVDHWVLGPTS